jgi:hypothetical protein
LYAAYLGTAPSEDGSLVSDGADSCGIHVRGLSAGIPYLGQGEQESVVSFRVGDLDALSINLNADGYASIQNEKIAPMASSPGSAILKATASKSGNPSAAL